VRKRLCIVVMSTFVALGGRVAHATLPADCVNGAGAAGGPGTGNAVGVAPAGNSYCGVCVPVGAGKTNANSAVLVTNAAGCKALGIQPQVGAYTGAKDWVWVDWGNNNCASGANGDVVSVDFKWNGAFPNGGQGKWYPCPNDGTGGMSVSGNFSVQGGVNAPAMPTWAIAILGTTVVMVLGFRGSMRRRAARSP
jgi:hypothetical protein